MTFDEFIEMAWNEYCSHMKAHHEWKADPFRRYIEVGTPGKKIGMPEHPETEGFSVSHWTFDQLRRYSREHYAVDLQMNASGFQIKLFGLPVTRRDGEKDYDIRPIPESPT